MKKYYANFTSICSAVVPIEANSLEEAREKADKMTDAEITPYVEPDDYGFGFDLRNVYEQGVKSNE